MLNSFCNFLNEKLLGKDNKCQGNIFQMHLFALAIGKDGEKMTVNFFFNFKD